MLTQTLESLFGMLGIELPPWAGSLVLLGILVMLGPAFYRNHKTKRARKAIQRFGLSGRPTEAQEAEIVGWVSSNPFGLVVVCEEAHKRGLKRLARLALDTLRASGAKPGEARRLERLLDPAKLTTPAAEALAVARLLQLGAHEGARQKLDQALARWPDHPELLTLSRRVEEASSEA